MFLCECVFVRMSSCDQVCVCVCVLCVTCVCARVPRCWPEYCCVIDVDGLDGHALLQPSLLCDTQARHYIVLTGNLLSLHALFVIKKR